MSEETTQGLATVLPRVWQDWAAADDWRYLGVISGLLDAHAFLGKQGLAAQALEPLFPLWWPGSSLSTVLDDLRQAGLVSDLPDGTCAVPAYLRPALVSAIDDKLGRYRLNLPEGEVEFADLMDGLYEHCHAGLDSSIELGEQPTGICAAQVFTAGKRSHFVLWRPFPLLLCARAHDYVSLLCHLPEAPAAAIARQIAGQPTLRERVALFDLARGYRVNLTRSEVFVYLERYVRRAFGLRLVPPQTLTQALMDGGLLSPYRA